MGDWTPITNDRLTKFEVARMIGVRSLQLAMIGGCHSDPVRAAIQEYENKTIPLKIRRFLPDGTHRDIEH